jgi:hypothetical protein
MSNVDHVDHALLMAAAATSGFHKLADVNPTLLGAGVGAGVGALGMGVKSYLDPNSDSSDVTRDALFGAGLGGVAGAGVGNIYHRGGGSFTAGLKNIRDNFNGTSSVDNGGKVSVPDNAKATVENAARPGYLGRLAGAPQTIVTPAGFLAKKIIGGVRSPVVDDSGKLITRSLFPNQKGLDRAVPKPAPVADSEKFKTLAKQMQATGQNPAQVSQVEAKALELDAAAAKHSLDSAGVVPQRQALADSSRAAVNSHINRAVGVINWGLAGKDLLGGKQQWSDTQDGSLTGGWANALSNWWHDHPPAWNVQKD